MTPEWPRFVDLVEQVMAADDLLPHVVAGVRAVIAEVAVLPASDMAGHTRALLTAAARALAERRGPTEAELAFVEQLAVTRARQGIPIEVVMAAIRVSERTIWTRARELAEADGLPDRLLLDARELYDDWADAVRARLIRAHRDAPSPHDGAWDRRAETLRRLLEGGSAAALAAAEAGFAPGAGLWVLVGRSGDAATEDAVRRLVDATRGPSLTAQIGDTLVAVSARRPPLPGRLPLRAPASTPAPVVGVAGPAPAEEVTSAHRQAVSTVPAAEASGRTGPVHVTEVASVVALLSRGDLAATVAAAHAAAYEALGPAGAPVARTVRTWLELDRDTGAAAKALFVHDNTVRNRVQRFAEATGIDPLSTFGGVDAWWLCRSWLPE